jgi:hypothetical protein
VSSKAVIKNKKAVRAVEKSSKTIAKIKSLKG